MSFRAGARIWRENKTLKDKSLEDAPRLLLDFHQVAYVGKAFELSNDGEATAVNIEPQKITFMKSTVTFSAVPNLSSKARVQLRADSNLASLMADAWRQKGQTVEVPISMNFESMSKRKYVSSWQISCRNVVPESSWSPSYPDLDIKFLGCRLAL
jgi:hypothetical protein